MTRDHPRSRGVYARFRKRRDIHARIIPARAGFTGDRSGRLRGRGDHPRSRGVYRVKVSLISSSSGSSPLARGLRQDRRHQPGARRIIPARAGFTFMILDFIHSAAGSSPLARGLLRRYLRRRINRRIIPARAGFTPAWRRACPAHPDHPRSRGVYQFALRATINILDHPRSRGVYRSKRLHHHLGHGSSPLARGLHLRILGIPTTSHATRPRLPSVPT